MAKPTIDRSPEHEPRVLLRLSIAKLLPDPEAAVRLGPPPKDEEAQIDELARAMYEQGQLQPIGVRKAAENGHYYINFGNRRAAAAALIEKKTGQPFPLDAILSDKSNEDAWVSAIYENVHRRNNSPIELANLMLEVKKRKQLDGPDWTKGVAEVLNVSRATVSQTVKLLNLPKSLQSKVHSGVLSAQSAFGLLENADSKVQEEIAARAEELAEEEERSKGRPARGMTSTTRKGKSDESTPQSASKRAASAQAEEAADEGEKGKVKSKHVLKAARELEATTKPRTRGELIEAFASLAESTDPYSDEILDFADFFVKKYATGQGTDRQFRNRLNAIDERISRRRKTA